MIRPSEPLSLERDEGLLASCGSFYATDKRIMRLGRSSGNGPPESISYEQLDSVENVTAPRTQTIALGVLVILLTIVIGPDGLVRAGCFLLGIVGVLVGFIYPRNYYQFQSSDWGKHKRRRWRLIRQRYTNERKFISVVRAEHAKRTSGLMTNNLESEKLNPKLFSILVVPADQPTAVTRAFEHEPDMLCIDLVGLLDPVDSEIGRGLVWSEIIGASRSNSLPLVQVSARSLECDLNACVWPGLWGVLIAAESVSTIQDLDGILSPLEETRNLPRSVQVAVLIETEVGLDSIPELISASSRVKMIVLGNADLIAEAPIGAGVDPFDSEKNLPLQNRWRNLTKSAADGGVVPLALIGTTLRSEELEKALETRIGFSVERVLEIARCVGFYGFLTVHPQVVKSCKYLGAPDGELTNSNGVSNG
jgi:citrate lyase beta subunit